MFLVAITEQIDSRQPELTPEAAANEVAAFLLQEQYRVCEDGWILFAFYDTNFFFSPFSVV